MQMVEWAMTPPDFLGSPNAHVCIPRRTVNSINYWTLPLTAIRDERHRMTHMYCPE